MTQTTGLIPDELLGNVNENDGGAVRLTVRSLATIKVPLNLPNRIYIP